MKKLMALVLAVFLCAALSACGRIPSADPGEGGQNQTQETDEPAQPPQPPQPLQPLQPAEPTEPEEAQLLDAWAEVLLGQWEVYHREDVGKIDFLTLNEDGTAQIGERAVSWEYDGNRRISSDKVYILVLDGENTLYEMTVWKENNDLHGQLKDPEDDYIILYKPDFYEILTITLDNIYDYFEMFITWEEERNGFDELEMVDTWQDFVLKEPYASRLSYVNDDSWGYSVVDRGAIEWRYQYGSFNVLLNPDGTVILENCVSEGEAKDICKGNGSSVQAYYHFFVPSTKDWYYPGADLDVEQWRAYNEHGYFNFEVVRVQLTLYLIPD